jgi:hypothetical protein
MSRRIWRFPGRAQTLKKSMSPAAAMAPRTTAPGAPLSTAAASRTVAAIGGLVKGLIDSLSRAALELERPQFKSRSQLSFCCARALTGRGRVAVVVGHVWQALVVDFLEVVKHLTPRGAEVGIPGLASIVFVHAE